MRPSVAALWQRCQESPFELSVSLMAVGIGAGNLAGRSELMTFWSSIWYSAMLVGGVLAGLGFIRNLLSVESTGLVLLLGGYAYSMLRRIAKAVDAVDVNAAIVAFGAIAIGLLIRVIVVRKAFRIREATARRVRRQWKA